MRFFKMIEAGVNGQYLTASILKFVITKLRFAPAVLPEL